MKSRLSSLLAVVLLALPAGAYAGGGREAGGGIALVGATVIDGTGAPPMSGAVVRISGRTIEALGAGKGSVPAGYRTFDLRGKTILPGFINAHVHAAYDSEQLRRWLRSGVTSVRDLGPFSTTGFLAQRDALNRDPLNARIISATPLICPPGGYGSVTVGSPADAEQIVRSFIDRGVDVVKIAIEDDLQGRTWTLMTPAVAKRIVEAAHSRGVRVSAHISHLRNLPIAIEAGVDDLAHMIVEPLGDADISAVVSHGIAWVPTLELWKGVSEIHGLDWDRIAVENLGRFYRAGGKVALGTDFEGYRNPFDRDFPVTEVSLMAKAGMRPMDIIVAGTRNAATVSGRGADLGTLEPGKIADLLVVDGNPLSDLSALARPVMVIHDGKPVSTGNARASSAAPHAARR